MKHQVAFTEPGGSLPAFVNLHETDDGQVRISVRSRGEAYPSRITISKDVLRRLLDESEERLASPHP